MLENRANPLQSPRTVAEAQYVAAVGAAALSVLAYDPKRNIKSTLACMRTLALINTSAALQM
jgi:hypothetical protein